MVTSGGNDTMFGTGDFAEIFTTMPPAGAGRSSVTVPREIPFPTKGKGWLMWSGTECKGLKLHFLFGCDRENVRVITEPQEYCSFALERYLGVNLEELRGLID